MPEFRACPRACPVGQRNIRYPGMDRALGTDSRADALVRHDNEAMVPEFDQVGICSRLARSGLCALERDEDMPGPTFCFEGARSALLQVWCVVANRQGVAVEGVDALPHLALQDPFLVLEVD